MFSKLSLVLLLVACAYAQQQPAYSGYKFHQSVPGASYDYAVSNNAAQGSVYSNHQARNIHGAEAAVLQQHQQQPQQLQQQIQQQPQQLQHQLHQAQPQLHQQLHGFNSAAHQAQHLAQSPASVSHIRNTQNPIQAPAVPQHHHIEQPQNHQQFVQNQHPGFAAQPAQVRAAAPVHQPIQSPQAGRSLQGGLGVAFSSAADVSHMTFSWKDGEKLF